MLIVRHFSITVGQLQADFSWPRWLHCYHCLLGITYSDGWSHGLPIESECLVVEFRGVSKHFKIQEPKTLKEFLSAFVAGKGAGQRFYALKDVSFGVRAGESLGIVGRNGSGKSTALKLVAGVMVPTDGQVIVRGHVCPLIELGAAFNPDLTGKENIYLGASILGLPNHTIRERISSIIDFAELRGFMDTPIKHYSSGMQVRLTFSVAVHCDPEILIIDESLAVGDAHFPGKVHRENA